MYSLFLKYRYNLAFVLVLGIGLTRMIRDYVAYGVNWWSIVLFVLATSAMLHLLHRHNRQGYAFVMFYAGFHILISICDVVFPYRFFDGSVLFAGITFLFSAPLFLIALVYFRKLKIFTLSEEELVARFIHATTSLEFSYDTKKWNEIWRVYAALVYKDAALGKLVPLLEHENKYVRGTVAFYLLAKHENRALHVLDELGRGEGSSAAYAKDIANRWRAGDGESFKYLKK